MDERTISGISYLKASKYRTSIALLLSRNIMTPADIQDQLAIRLNHVSMHLKDLREKEIVICLNENAKKGRLYQLSEYGKTLVIYLK